MARYKDREEPQEERQSTEDVFGHMGDVHFEEVKRHWLEQLPVVAAMMAQEQEDPEDYERAADAAFDLIGACVRRLEE